MAGATEHSPNMDPAMAGATEHVAADAAEHTVSCMTFEHTCSGPCSACAVAPLTVHRDETIGMRSLKK